MKELLLLKMAKLSAEVAAFTACANRELSRGDWQRDWQKEILEVLREFDEAEAAYLRLLDEPYEKAFAAIDPSEGVRTFTMPERVPTHRCKICGALWIEYPDSWSLHSPECGKCCDEDARYRQFCEDSFREGQSKI